MSDEMLNAALEYAEIGFSVVPVHRNKKHPCVKWIEFQTRQASADELEAWWKKFPDADVGFITGKASNVAVIDCDSPAAVKWVEERYPTSVSQKTTQGKHFFYRPNSAPVKTVGKVRPDIDVRGDGGFSVLAPSSHKSGIPYKLEYAQGFQGWDDLAPFPYDIFPEAVAGVKREPVTREPVFKGARNNTLTRLAGRYYKVGLDYDQVVLLCHDDNRRYQPPLPVADVEVICKSIWCAEQKSNPVIEVLDETDIKETNISLQIPDEILHPGGLIDTGLTGLVKRNCSDIPQFLLPVVFTAMANSIAGKIRFNDLWPNIFCVKVGRTSTGKSDSDKVLNRAIKKIDEMKGFYGATGIVSGPGLMRSLVLNPQCLIVLDEMTSLFRQYAKDSAITDGITKVLLELFSGSGGDIYLPYSNQKNVVSISNSCVSLVGNATSLIFEAINQEDFRSGKMQRFDFYCYDGQVLDRGREAASAPELKSFCAGLQVIRESKQPDNGQIDSLIGVYNVAKDSECVDILQDFSKEIIQRQRVADKSGEDEGFLGIISRGYDLAIKYAMIHMCNEEKTIFRPMLKKDLDYGIKVSKILTEWKLYVLGGLITTGEFHRDCEIFKAAILKTIKAGKKNPRFRTLAHRKPRLKNWQPEYSEKIIKVLKKRKEIVTKEIEGETCYYLTKNF